MADNSTTRSVLPNTYLNCHYRSPTNIYEAPRLYYPAIAGSKFWSTSLQKIIGRFFSSLRAAIALPSPFF